MPYIVPRGPRRIVCLTEEPTEILYALGESDRIVGISTYTVRPPEAAQDKPVVSAFLGASTKRIKALEPDLIIGFSDIQARLAKQLIEAHLPVLIFNQRSIAEILEVVVSIGGLVGKQLEARRLVEGYVAGLDAAAEAASAWATRPKVYFEEWDDPMITAIQWVSELIEVAGGQALFADRSQGAGAKDRFVTVEEVVGAAPDLVLASWCGKAFDQAAFEARPGFGELPAVQRGQVFDVPPEIILQPGPASLTDGLAALHARIAGAR